ncbi:hypothetical protein TIFTF001_045655 [Ficus carica]|uniref:Uncharacterized protein n=1 Tax=Ficus carica TaxID=3494 RepID=A0AA87YSJ9_FICCA|nr:hypothetical protein TIFTF001_045655 [Ficus carica]
MAPENFNRRAAEVTTAQIETGFESSAEIRDRIRGAPLRSGDTPMFSSSSDTATAKTAKRREQQQDPSRSVEI